MKKQSKTDKIHIFIIIYNSSKKVDSGPIPFIALIRNEMDYIVKSNMYMVYPFRYNLYIYYYYHILISSYIIGKFEIIDITTIVTSCTFESRWSSAGGTLPPI